MSDMNVCSLELYDDGCDQIRVVLIIDYQGLRLELTPDNQDKILSIDVDAESGRFDTNPNNGEFMFSWSPTKIKFRVTRNSGSMTIKIPSNPRLREDFHEVLREWKEICQANRSS